MLEKEPLVSEEEEIDEHAVKSSVFDLADGRGLSVVEMVPYLKRLVPGTTEATIRHVVWNLVDKGYLDFTAFGRVIRRM